MESPCHGAGPAMKGAASHDAAHGEPDGERGGRGTGSDLLCRYVCQTLAVVKVPAISFSALMSAEMVPAAEDGRLLVLAHTIDHVPLP